MIGFEFHPHPAEIPPVNPDTCQAIALRIGAGIVALLVALCLWAAFVSPSHARDGFDQNGRPLVCDPTLYGDDVASLKGCRDWIAGVYQPKSRSKCCGEGDAFVADLYREGACPAKKDGDDTPAPKTCFYAIITVDYPALTGDDGEGNTITFPAIAAGTQILVPPNRINRSFDEEGNRLKEGGNPTGHGIIFLGGTKYETVLCYFAPPLT